MMPTLRQLECFVAVAETGSMSAAGTHLRLSQSAVSLAVASLERQLQVQLLVRSKGHRVALTAEGIEILLNARRVLADVTELVGQAQSSNHALSGNIVVGCYQTLTPFVMPRVLAEFNLRHPAIRVDFQEGSLEELHEALARGQLEAAVLYNFHLPAELVYTTIYDNARTRVLLAEGHPLAAERRISMVRLAEEPFIVYEPAAPHYIRLLAEVGVKPTIRHRSSNFEAVRCLVARGLGVSMLNQIPDVGVSYEGRPLVTREILEPTPPLPVVVAYHAGIRLPRRTRAFIECCADVFRDTGSGGAAAEDA